MGVSTLLPIVIAAPLLGFVLLLLLGRRLPRAAISAIACGSVLVALGCAAASTYALAQTPDTEVTVHLYSWLAAGQFSADLELYLDPLSALMILIVTGVGFLIHVYSTGYMHEEKDYGRYFAALNLFTFSMLLLVLGRSLPVMFVGWEGVGLCSYLLIGFDYWKDSAADAGKKAFIVNRIGDAGFLLAMFLTFDTFQTLDIRALLDTIGHGPPHGSVLTGIALLLFVGATGKSAQIPLFVWLPDAMAGPTPVSALIHAATMVTAGIYMIARLAPLYLLAPVALMVVACVGAATAFMAATIGITQSDIKKVLAYSTVSQLGYMFLGLGAGAFSAAVFHVMTHAFFKALLFLGAGSVIHALHGEQDIWKMGGLRKAIPWTYGTFLMATIAISGLPPFAGFFSKDAILAGVLHSTVLPHGLAVALYVVGLGGALITAFYMFRLLILTFHGSSRVDPERAHHLHESPRSMLIPLVVLAVLSVVGGFLGFPHLLGAQLGWHESDMVSNWLEPSLTRGMKSAHGETNAAGHAEEGEGGLGGELLLMGLSTLVALGGIGLAHRTYLPTAAVAEQRARSYAGLHRVLLDKYYWDEAYDALFVKPLGRLSRFLLREVDLGGIDFLVNAVSVAVETFGNLLKFLQTGYVRNYALAFLVGAAILVLWLS